MSTRGTSDYRSSRTCGADGRETPFYLTCNEPNARRQYHLYRVFRFRADPRLFSVQGAFDRICQLDAVQYLGRVVRDRPIRGTRD